MRFQAKGIVLQRSGSEKRKIPDHLSKKSDSKSRATITLYLGELNKNINMQEQTCHELHI